MDLNKTLEHGNETTMGTRSTRILIAATLVFALAHLATSAAWAQTAEGEASKAVACASTEGAAAESCIAQADEPKPVGEESVASGPPPSAQAAGSASQAPAAPAPAPSPGDDQAELAKKLSNPVASLISVPFQSNFDFGMGPNENGFRFTMNVQPVIPVALNKDWNMIVRTIWPIIHQSDVIPGTSQTGLGDNVTSFFFSPNKTEPFIWGLGPALLIPTATNDFLGTEKFGIGPTVVVLKQKKGWTVGALANHIWSVAGNDARADVNSTFFQPFVSYTTRTAWTFTVNTESTYDWTGEKWSVPLNLSVAKLVRFGHQPVSLGGGLKCWATSPTGGPQGCGFRLVTTLLFPKK